MWGKRETVPNTTLSITTRMMTLQLCIKIGSDESNFNVSLVSCEGQGRKVVYTNPKFKYIYI